MVEIFSSGAFANYKIQDTRYTSVLNESRSFSAGERKSSKSTVFISHKHSDLEDLKGLIGYLEQYYNVVCYIDSEDPGMPGVTSGATAERIKKIIQTTDRFILLATDDAIASKWCNWELGYGDACKYKEKIAILPMKNYNRTFYTGSEYMQIYPRILYLSSNDVSASNRIYHPELPMYSGYYVLSVDQYGFKSYISLYSWLH